MQIQPTNNYSRFNNRQSPQFKAAYPIVHWVAETNGSYAPILAKDAAEKLNNRIISMLTANSKEIVEKIATTKEAIKIKESGAKKIIKKSLNQLNRELSELLLTLRVKSYIARTDADYAKKSTARAFYNREGGFKHGKYDAVATILTGDDAEFFNREFGRPIGVARAKSDVIGLEKAIARYWEEGAKFVERKAKEFKKFNGEPAELHVKLEAVRNSAGKIINHNVVDMRFFPKEGPNNPFMLTQWAQK